MELLVVIAVIAMVSAVALPSIWQLFSAGSYSQAYNLISASLMAARSEAIQSGTFAGLHVQLAHPSSTDTDTNLRGACFAGVVQYFIPNASNPTMGQFRSVAGYLPRRMPGTVAFGEMSSRFVSSGGSFQNVSGGLNATSDLDNFTSFTVVFSSSGAAVRQTPYRNPGNTSQDGWVIFDTADKAFLAGSSTYLWRSAVANLGGGECPATAMAMFDSGDILKITDRAGYLNGQAEYLPINVHTGQLFTRK